jgi:selenoprotein W-related protein
MAAEIKKEFGIETELIKGGGGVYEVMLDGRLIFSKQKTGRFPESEEIFQLIRSK